MFMQRLRRVILFLILAYLALFCLCLAYEYTTYSPGIQRQAASVSASSVAVSKKNYASAKYDIQSPAARAQVDQKYERTATVQSQSATFDDDEVKTRSMVAANNGIVQFESGVGTNGRRVLFLYVGIAPDRFDTFYKDIQTIGTVQSMEIAKTDKTNEFLTLKAQRASLEKNRAALMELKRRDGRIDELMALEQKILQIEQELQNLGVQLGEFDEVNAFCTVRFTLVEYTESVRTRSIVSYCKSAFFAATTLYAAGLAMLLFLSLTAFVLLLAIDKFNVVRKLADAIEKEKSA